MVTVKKIADFIDNLLGIKEFERDPSNNGLQILASEGVQKVGFAVDASLASFKQAAEDDCDMLVVHHGISWGNGFKRLVDDMVGRRVAYLFNNKLSLYGVHLPLDAHPVYGHNACISKMLNLQNVEEFGQYVGYNIGFSGELPEALTVSQLVELLNDKLDTNCSFYGADSHTLVERIGIVSGGAADDITEADTRKLDAYITGEMNHYHVHSAEELKPVLITAGHYKTEVPGVRAVMKAVAEYFNVECKFYDLPTGL